MKTLLRIFRGAWSDAYAPSHLAPFERPYLAYRWWVAV